MANRATQPADPAFDLILQAGRRHGHPSFTAIEKACGLGQSTFLNAQKRGSRLVLDTILKVASAIECSPVELVPEGDDRLAMFRSAGGSAAVAPADPTLIRVPIGQLWVSHFNSRQIYEVDSIQDLARSIASQGLLQPLLVRSTVSNKGVAVYEVVDGERRRQALEHLEFGLDSLGLPAALQDGVPCLVTEANDSQALAQSILANFHRVDANPMEEAEAFARLQSLEPKVWTSQEIAARLGMSLRHVQARLKLVKDLSDATKDAVRGGAISGTQARALATCPIAHQPELLSLIESEEVRTEEEILTYASHFTALDMLTAGVTLIDSEQRGPLRLERVLGVNEHGVSCHWCTIRADNRDGFPVSFSVHLVGGQLAPTYGTDTIVLIAPEQLRDALLKRFGKAGPQQTSGGGATDGDAEFDDGYEGAEEDDIGHPAREPTRYETEARARREWSAALVARLREPEHTHLAAAVVLLEQISECDWRLEQFKADGLLSCLLPFHDFDARAPDSFWVQEDTDPTVMLMALLHGTTVDTIKQALLNEEVSRCSNFYSVQPIHHELARRLDLPLPAELLPEEAKVGNVMAGNG